MVRTQIQLTEEQAERLKDIAHNRNQSMAAVIREALDHFLASEDPDREALYRRAAKVIGKYRSGLPDISLEHDRYLEEDFK